MLGGMAMNLLLTEAQAATGAVVSPVVWILYFAALIGIFIFFSIVHRRRNRRIELH